MTAQSIMSTDLKTLAPDVTVGEAMLAMCRYKVHNLPVVDQQGVFIGLFSLRRVTHAMLPMAAQINGIGLDFEMTFLSDQSDDYLLRLRELGKRPVADLLEKKKKLRFCTPQTPIPRLLQLLTENPTTLPVVVLDGEKKKVVGMVSTWDVLSKIALNLYAGDGSDGAVNSSTADG